MDPMTSHVLCSALCVLAYHVAQTVLARFGVSLVAPKLPAPAGPGPGTTPPAKPDAQPAPAQPDAPVPGGVLSALQSPAVQALIAVLQAHAAKTASPLDDIAFGVLASLTRPAAVPSPK
jgi:hypothetical protein